ncbi:MAG: ShlB/FhaC/HecB family hemolysin secretion/activation protein, partial [Novosphingobium sp.]
MSRDELRGITNQAPTAAPRLSIAGGVERSPCALDDPAYADIKVTINEVSFNGLKEIAPGELDATWRPLANAPQPISALCEIRDAAGTIL